VSEHHHDVTAAGSKLKYGIIVTCIVLVLEVAGGLMSNSLALLSDAGHVLADGIALLLSWYGVRQAERPASHRMTFGYHRVGVLIAIVNAVSILAISGVILYEAAERFTQKPPVNSGVMLGIAVLGLIANIVVAQWLRKDRDQSINIRSAFWHAAGDALASVGVIIGAIVIMFTGLYVVDAIVSMLISVIILISAFGIFREGFRIILEGVPKDINVDEVVNAIKGLPEVRDVHDIHIWSISSNLRAMSTHIVVDDCYVSQAEAIRRRVEDTVRSRFDIGHTTVQIECGQCGKDGLFCSLEPANEAHGEGEHSGKVQ
jgi:cobalt-zinc-cadmium efflux system protein